MFIFDVNITEHTIDTTNYREKPCNNFLLNVAKRFGNSNPFVSQRFKLIYVEAQMQNDNTNSWQSFKILRKIWKQKEDGFVQQLPSCANCNVNSIVVRRLVISTNVQ